MVIGDFLMVPLLTTGWSGRSVPSTMMLRMPRRDGRSGETRSADVRSA
jgi:hypothetical protein